MEEKKLVAVDMEGLTRLIRNIVNECMEEHRRKAHDVEGLLSAKELMGKLNVSAVTLWRWKNTGVLTPVKIGRKNLYRVDDVERLLA